MWRKTACVIILSATVAADHRLAGAEPAAPERLLTRLDWVRFDVSMGRLLAAGSRVSQNQRQVLVVHATGGLEALSARIDHGLVSLRYAWQTDTEQLTVEVVRRDDLTIHWKHPVSDGRTVAVCLEQPPQGDVTLSIRSEGAKSTVFRAPTLWHLLILEPDACRTHLVPVLVLFRPNWSVDGDVKAIRNRMFEMAVRPPAVSGQEVRALVDQLGLPQFRLRCRADRQLRAMGNSLLCYFNELDPETLDPEQRMRIRAIKNSFRDHLVDTPQAVACWLLHSKTVWIALLADGDPERRALASRHLDWLSDTDIEFDPRGPRSVRSRQIASLRSQLLRR